MTALGAQAALAQASWVGVRLMVGYRALELGAEPSLIAVLAALFAAPAIVAAIPIGQISDRAGGSFVAFIGLAIAGLATATLTIFPSSLALLLGITAVLGLGHLCIMVGQQTFAAQSTGKTSTDHAFGRLSAAASIGQLIGPPAATTAASLHGGAVPDTTAGLIVCLGFIALALPFGVSLRRSDRSSRRTRSCTVRAPLAEVVRTPDSGAR